MMEGNQNSEPFQSESLEFPITSDGEPIQYTFNSSVDRVFGVAAGNYIFNFTLDMVKGNSLFFKCEGFSPNYDFNLTLELWDSNGRYYHIVERKFGVAYGAPLDQAFETSYGAPRNGTYTLIATIEVFYTLSIHFVVQQGGKVINDFYPESGVVGQVYHDLRVYNESVKVHDYLIPFDSDTEYSFNLVRVSPISEPVYLAHYAESFPRVYGNLTIRDLTFPIWVNITSGGNREQIGDFKVTIGSFENNTVSFRVELTGIHTNMVFLFIAHSTKRIGDGPDPLPSSPPVNKTADDTIEEFFNDSTNMVKTVIFDDSFLLGSIIVLLIGGIIIAIKSQTAVFEVD
jgi:hypothetical protein